MSVKPRSSPKPVLPAAEVLLAQVLFDMALPGEVDDLDAESRMAITRFVAAAAVTRAAGAAIVHLEPAITDDAAPGRRRMMLAIIGDDRPFLVSSTSAAITAAGLDIERLLHPVVDVRRDSEGRLAEVVGLVEVVGLAGEAPAPGVTRESMIYVEIERTGARGRAALVASLNRVLYDVRAAVDDWEAMQAALHGVATALGENPPPIAPHRVSEAVAFLEWLAADNFTLLGVRRYDLSGDLDDAMLRLDNDLGSDLGLGLLRDPDYPVWTGVAGPSDTPRALRALLASSEPLLITKAGAVVSVQRRVNGELVSVKGFDRQGRVISETRFFGLYTSQAMSASPRKIPLLRRKVTTIIDNLGFGLGGHSGRALLHVLENFPRQELIEATPERLQVMALGLLSLLDRPRPRLFARADPFGRFVSVLVYVPRDSYSSALRENVGRMLAEVTGGRVGRFDVELRAEGLARVHYDIGISGAIDFDDAMEAELERRLRQLVRGWDEDLETALIGIAGPTRAARLTLSHGRALSASYRAQHSPAEAAADSVARSHLHDDTGRAVRLLRCNSPQPRSEKTDPGQVRLKIYRLGKIIPLSDAVPVLENFGLKVIEEFPFDLAGGTLGWIHDFMLEVANPAVLDDWEALVARVEPALTTVLLGVQDNDLFKFDGATPGAKITKIRTFENPLVGKHDVSWSNSFGTFAITDAGDIKVLGTCNKYPQTHYSHITGNSGKSGMQLLQDEISQRSMYTNRKSECFLLMYPNTGLYKWN